MKEELFKELVASVREGSAILRGKVAPSRRFVIDAPNIKRIRTNYKLSQGQIARRRDFVYNITRKNDGGDAR